MDKIKKIFISSMQDSGFWVKVCVAGAILSATFLLLAIDSSKVNRSEISILVNVKSQVAIKQQKQLFENVVALPKTLSFYDKMLKNNPAVRDVTKGLSLEQRKERWNEMVSVQPVSENASIFKISISAKRQSDSKILVEKATRTLFDTVAFYYDIRKDFDLRIIDGPITKTEVPGFAWLAVFSILTGFSLAFVISFVFYIGKNRIVEGSQSLRKNLFANWNEKNKLSEEKEIESLRNLYDTDKIEPEIEIVESVEKNPRFEEMKKLTKQIEPGKYPNFPEMPSIEKKTASAPDNLPVADEISFGAFEASEPELPVVKEESLQAEEENLAVDTKREPTPEELKKRLNQLLRGEI